MNVGTAGPVITAITPTSAAAGTPTSITIDGWLFDPAATVTVGGVAATGVAVTGNQITASITPSSGSEGSLQDVVVSNPSGPPGTLPGGLFVRFADTSGVAGFEPAIERVRRNAITAGCTPGNYCPLSSVTRAQMAVFLLKAKESGSYVPPPATGVFEDVDPGSPVAPWIEELYHRGITGGCNADPLRYCPNSAVTRAQMAVFLLKTVEGSGYQPPPATGVFGDVLPASTVAPWIEELARRGITGGCGGGNYCPNDAVNRAQMAVFLDKAFNLRNPQETGGTRRDFHYTPEMNLMAVSEYATAASPPIRYEYVWMNGRPVASVDRTTDTTWWAMTDHLGTPLAFTNSAQTVTWRAEHEPYGRVWTLRTADSFQPLRLPGQEAEQMATVSPNGDTDRSYNVFRWYRGGWGRYTQSDPLAQELALPFVGLNVYAYVEGNPTNYIDPEGLSGSKPGGPYHPPIGVSTRCEPGDTCSQIEGKMWLLKRMIDSHTGWDWTVPKPRGGNRHAQEIEQLWKQYARCQSMYEERCRKKDECDTCKKVAVGAGIGLGAYITYRCIRFLPSLYPPFWPTIPWNLATP